MLSPKKTGVNFVNEITENTDFNFLDYVNFYNGSGVGIGDFNNDGLEDVYFTANMVSNKLYLNQGGLKFKDVTQESGLDSVLTWSTGVAIVDINGDRKLDIYVCQVSIDDYLVCNNLLFINQGTNSNNVPIFIEQSIDYGLDIQSTSTQSAFFDYDLDGDLDMYLLNNPGYDYNKLVPKDKKRYEIDSIKGDMLF